MTAPGTGLTQRFLLSATAVIAVAGFYGGLARIGVPLPQADAAADLHGTIMMQGVLGTLVPLERAVALRTPVWLIGPVLSVLATALLLAGAPPVIAMILFAAASMVFLCMSAHVVLLQPAPFTFALLLGASSLVTASVLLLVGAGGETTSAIPWWLSFLVVTVAGERLELSRFAGHGAITVATFFAVAGILLAGAAVFAAAARGPFVMGAGLVLLAAWLLRFDIARRTIRQRGQAGFMAACILCGHAWLLVAGLVAFAIPDGYLPPDAFIHAVTVGFALSMVMGHSLVILPAVAGISIRFSPSMFAPLFLLQFSMGLRIAADGFFPDWRWLSGTLTLLALFTFAILLVRNSRGRLRTTG
jgi:hypothetical protein